MKFIIPSKLILLAALLCTFGACNRPSNSTADQPRPTPSAEDIRIGRQAISLKEVSLLARNGFHKDALAAVVRRHIPEELSAEEELKLKGVAQPELIAAMKDPQYILTPAQKDAYDEAKGKQLVQKEQASNFQVLQANNERQLNAAQTDHAWADSVAEQAEAARRERAHRELVYAAEQAKAERAAREQEQLRSVENRWRTMDAQNSYHRPYNTPIPIRSDRNPRN
jgi:hypothetical protein